MKSKKSARKKFILGLVAVVTAAGILSLDLASNVSVAEARQPIFQKIQPYQQKGLNVLEIVPADTEKDLGYFFLKQDGPEQVKNLTQGTIFEGMIPDSSEFAQMGEAAARNYLRNYYLENQWVQDQARQQGYTNVDAYIEWQMGIPNNWLISSYLDTGAMEDLYYAVILRSYGMIRPNGPDLGTGANSQFPIYDRDGKGIFGGSSAADSHGEYEVSIGGKMALGYYESVDDNSGAYTIIQGYILGDGQDHEYYDPDDSSTPLTVTLEEGVFYQINYGIATASMPLPGNPVGAGQNGINTPETNTPSTEERQDSQNQVQEEDTNVEEETDTDSNGIAALASPNENAVAAAGNDASVSDPAQIPQPLAAGDTVIVGYMPVSDNRVIGTAVHFVGAGGEIKFIYRANDPGRYYGYTSQKVTYLNKNRYYKLGAWIKEYILGDANLNCATNYNYKLANRVTASDIAWADLIYISGRAEQYAVGGMDLTDAMVMELYNQNVVHHKAVIMDYLIYDGPANGYTNIDKLALLLWQEEPQKIAASNAGSFRSVKPDADDRSGDTEKFEMTNTTFLTEATLQTLQGTRMTGYGGTFAINNIYVYDHKVSYFLNSKLSDYQIDARDIIANGDMATYYTSAVANGGFQAVLAYIQINNEGLVSGKMPEGFVRPATAIQFILCYRGEDLIISKETYSVLEIQPTKEFKFNSGSESKDFALETQEVKQNRNDFIKDCLNENIVAEDSQRQDLVSFYSMTIDEFNTMQDDLLTTYDVIYIGSVNSTYFRHTRGMARNVISTAVAPTYNDQANITLFSDLGMCGYVYFNTGDKIHSAVGRDNVYSSRDLTVAKLNELKSFLESSGLIIVDGDLMRSSSTGIPQVNPTDASDNTAHGTYYDHGRIDNSSNMYQLFTFAGYTEGSTTYYSNFVSEADLAAGLVAKGDMTNSLNRERLVMLMTQRPNIYTYTPNTAGYMSTVTYLTADSADGKYYLDFEFSIANTAEVASPTEFYLVHFYQDMNANGRFEPSEEKFDYQVTLAADGSQAASGKDAEGVTRYSLNADVMYKLRRQVPSDEGGFINWCIRVEKLSNASVYCEETGYTAIKPREQKYINILQITPNDGGTINLETLEESDALYRYLTAPAVADQYVITVRTITVSQFQLDTQNFYASYRQTFDTEDELWTDYFNNFERAATDNAGYTAQQILNDEDKPMSVNMVILGFGNEYTQFSSLYPIRALKSYMDSTKPLLTSKNVVGSNISVFDVNGFKPNTGRTLNYHFLSYFGQDRYGYTFEKYNVSTFDINQNTVYNRTQIEAEEYLEDREGVRAVAYVPGSGRNSVHLIPIGYTNTTRAKLNQRTGDPGFINTDAVNNLNGRSDPTVAASNTYVDQMNEGQIAHYPYEVSGSVLLSKTQAQYFQLDLDTDGDGDGNSDLIVWYTLGDMANSGGGVIEAANIYSATPGDGINNYYVYNYTNITFTGFGAASKGAITPAEGQLFVNTLIAAYESGLVNPTVSFYQTDDSNSEMLDSIAVPYDRNVTQFNAVDSSIQLNERGNDYLYKFVNPNTQPGVEADGTKAYFKVQDSNMVRGEKTAKVAFYLEVPDNTSGRYVWPDGNVSDIMHVQLNDNTVVSVVRIPIDIYTADFGTKLGTSTAADTSNNPRLSVGTMYGFYAPMSYLNDRGGAKIYIQADTSWQKLDGSTGRYVDSPLGTAFDMFTIIKQDLLKLD